ELVRLLEEARGAAVAAGEWQVVRLVQDAIEYAEGRILRHDFEDRYRLFGDGQRRESHTGFLGSTMKAMHQWLVDSGREFLADRPDAGIEEFLEHFRAQGEDAMFLQAPEDRPGRYVIPRGQAETALWLERIIRSRRVDIEDPAAQARRIAASPEALALLAADDQGLLVLQAAELRRRAVRLKELRTVVEDRTATEADLQQALEGQYWIFGGRFVGEAAQRRLVPGDELDIPLIRGDGALHVVELKRAMSLKSPLVKRHRNAWVPAAQVNEAFGQAINYLTGLDENRDRIRTELGIETRRASALVLVGHPALHPDVPEEEINEALRTFNSHIARVEVLTYKELLDNAERSLAGEFPV
ncbi:Shedu anti-phage system protein SduA domain-containing protein, partial [Streptomyces sp. NPDC059627]